jgi:hypothetical protein
MSSLIAKELSELSRLAAANCHVRGVAVVTEGEKASNFIILWLRYLRSCHATGTADCLIDATASAVREGIACVVLGLVRPALNSLRLQIDLSLAWLYFKDHPVEWRRVQEIGDAFKLKTDLLKYISETIPGYSTRFGLLRDCKTRRLDDPYRLLSAHIHGQSEPVLPNVQKPRHIIATQKAQDEFLKLQHECSEYINDVFWSVFADRWASVPIQLKSSIESRFKSPDQRACFFG